jgi:hypothetical protein
MNQRYICSDNHVHNIRWLWLALKWFDTTLFALVVARLRPAPEPSGRPLADITRKVA